MIKNFNFFIRKTKFIKNYLFQSHVLMNQVNMNENKNSFLIFEPNRGDFSSNIKYISSTLKKNNKIDEMTEMNILKILNNEKKKFSKNYSFIQLIFILESLTKLNSLVISKNKKYVVDFIIIIFNVLEKKINGSNNINDYLTILKYMNKIGILNNNWIILCLNYFFNNIYKLSNSNILSVLKKINELNNLKKSLYIINGNELNKNLAEQFIDQIMISLNNFFLDNLNKIQKELLINIEKFNLTEIKIFWNWLSIVKSSDLDFVFSRIELIPQNLITENLSNYIFIMHRIYEIYPEKFIKIFEKKINKLKPFIFNYLKNLNETKKKYKININFIFYFFSNINFFKDSGQFFSVFNIIKNKFIHDELKLINNKWSIKFILNLHQNEDNFFSEKKKIIKKMFNIYIQKKNYLNENKNKYFYLNLLIIYNFSLNEIENNFELNDFIEQIFNEFNIYHDLFLENLIILKMYKLINKDKLKDLDLKLISKNDLILDETKNELIDNLDKSFNGNYEKNYIFDNLYYDFKIYEEKNNSKDQTNEYLILYINEKLKNTDVIKFINAAINNYYIILITKKDAITNNYNFKNILKNNISKYKLLLTKIKNLYENNNLNFENIHLKLNKKNKLNELIFNDNDKDNN